MKKTWTLLMKKIDVGVSFRHRTNKALIFIEAIILNNCNMFDEVIYKSQEMRLL